MYTTILCKMDWRDTLTDDTISVAKFTECVSQYTKEELQELSCISIWAPALMQLPIHYDEIVVYYDITEIMKQKIAVVIDSEKVDLSLFKDDVLLALAPYCSNPKRVINSVNNINQVLEKAYIWRLFSYDTIQAIIKSPYLNTASAERIWYYCFDNNYIHMIEELCHNIPHTPDFMRCFFQLHNYKVEDKINQIRDIMANYPLLLQSCGTLNLEYRMYASQDELEVWFYTNATLGKLGYGFELLKERWFKLYILLCDITLVDIANVIIGLMICV